MVFLREKAVFLMWKLTNGIRSLFVMRRVWEQLTEMMMELSNPRI